MPDAFNWTFDAAVGIYKNHQLSKKLRKVAAGATIVAPFARDYGIGFKAHAGQYINIMHIERLPNSPSSTLNEFNRIPIRKPAYGNRQIQVVEYGEGVEVTNLAEQLSVFAPMDQLQSALRLQMEEALDTATAKAFMDPTAVMVVFTPTGLTSGTFATGGVPTAVATAGLTFDHCTMLADYLRDTIHTPPFEGDNYVGITCNRNMRSLKNDRYWQEWHKYLSKGDFVFKGEMGMTERIRWVECNRALAFSNVAGTSSFLGEGVVFGDEAVARLEAEAPHLRYDANYQSDFGRMKAAAWYGILGFGSVWDVPNDGKAKIIHINSL
jgi:N4-gp56 family major capsid protein